MANNKAPESKFAYVTLTAKRARQLQLGARPLIDLPRSRKPTRVAQEELESGLLDFELPEIFSTFPDEKERDGKRRKE
jgi:DNA-directed RNA polymerase omega subunit